MMIESLGVEHPRDILSSLFSDNTARKKDFIQSFYLQMLSEIKLTFLELVAQRKEKQALEQIA